MDEGTKHCIHIFIYIGEAERQTETDKQTDRQIDRARQRDRQGLNGLINDETNGCAWNCG